jgi:hypothetical protein
LVPHAADASSRLPDEEPSVESEVRRYHGFSLRLTAGIGYASASRDVTHGLSSISGLDAVLSLDVGSTPIENLIVFGRLSGFAFNHMGSSDSSDASGAYFLMFGAGARYHFMPFDWYASGALALAAGKITNDAGTDQNTHPGFGLELETGKNWWAGTKFQKRAVGLGLRFAYVNCGSSHEGSSKPWVSTALSLVFSVSYN